MHISTNLPSNKVLTLYGVHALKTSRYVMKMAWKIVCTLIITLNTTFYIQNTDMLTVY